TKSFVHGVPLYGVLVGIEIHGEAEVGVAHFPALGETVSAALGLGCRWKRRAAGEETGNSGSQERGRESSAESHASTVDRLAEAVVLTTDEKAIRRSPLGDGWARLTDRVAYSRTWGDCYGHCLVATGRAEVMVDPELNPWDAAPLLPIVTESGGRFTDLTGNPTIHGGSGVSTNGRLHDEVLGILTGR
ncbi:MAG: inositol monophosphatase family protein, partial [Longimicrobiales bacterium]|nr:inositol monophosphatase family protein [Longimicrobiales bacterium]